MLLEELKPGLRVAGLIPADVVTVIFAQWHGTDALELTFKTTGGALNQQVVFRKDEDKLSVAQEAALLAGLANNMTYLNIHTSTSPGGEIRGFLTAQTGRVPPMGAVLAYGGHSFIVRVRDERRVGKVERRKIRPETTARRERTASPARPGL